MSATSQWRPLALCLLGVLSPAAQAGALSELYQTALQRDPVYLAAQRTNEATAESVFQSRAAWRPTVSLAVSGAQTQSHIRQTPTQSGYVLGERTYLGSEYALNVAQPLYSPVARALSAQADARERQLEVEQETTRQDLIWRVLDRYIAAAAAYEARFALDAEVAALREQGARVDRRCQAGLARAVESLDAQARLDDARARAADADAKLYDALQGVRELSGELPLAIGLLDAGIEVSAWPGWAPAPGAEAGLALNPWVQVRQHAIEVAQAELRRQQGGGESSLDGALKLGRARSTGSLYGAATDIGTNELRVTWNVPLYSGGIASSREREAASALERTREERTQVERNIERGIDGARQRVRAAQIRVQALGQAVRAGTEALRHKRLAYESGMETHVAVLDAYRELARVQVEQSRARYDWMLAVLSHQRMAGVLDEDLLRACDALLGRQVRLEAVAD